MSDDDSDCTVGIQDEEDCDTSSPSILGAPEINNVEPMIVDVPLSQTALQRQISVPTVSHTSDTNRIREDDLSLSHIISKQVTIEQTLIKTPSLYNLTIIEREINTIEKSLKAVSSTNQNERKAISVSYSEITNQTLSQKQLMEAKQELREKLTILADRQKQLLSCFNKQKDLGTRIIKYKETVHQQQQQPVIIQNQPPSDSLAESQSTLNIHSQGIYKVCRTKGSGNGDHQLSLNNSQPLISATSSSGDGGTGGVSVAGGGDSGADFAQPVRLDALISRNLLKPNTNCLSCTLMGCLFKATLLQNGNIQGRNGKIFLLPQHWISDCWSTLGHSKKITRRHAYKNILYNEVDVLMSYCELYNKQQVNSYKKHTVFKGTMPMETTPTCPSIQPVLSLPSTVKPFNITEILVRGVLVCHQPPSDHTSLDLPKEFWDTESFENIPAHILRQIEDDLIT